MLRVALALIASLVAVSAQAAEKPDFAPPASWVVPLGGPKTFPKDDGAAIRVLILDKQVRFGEADRSTYTETMTRIQSAQGLGAMGTVSLSWKPDTGALTVHKVHILRGDQVIDVLARQAFTVLRRENNLEAAMLDGVLTATLQPEGLQVGDILDVAATRIDREPVLGGRVEALMAGITQISVDHLQLRAQWPSNRKVRSRFTEGFNPAKPRQTGAVTTLQIDANDLQPVHGPSGAPPRFSHLREVEISEFQSWAEVSALLEPLYAKASTLTSDSPLRAEVAKIKAASNDPKVRAIQALNLVQGQTRYVFLGMNDGGLVPAPADLTWTRRFGDCKGKTVLLLALLRELGIPAEAVLVSTQRGDGLDERLPGVGVFDHVMVRAMIGDRDYWLDGTRTGDLDLDRIRMPDLSWGLPLQASGGALVRLEQRPLDEPTLQIMARFDASKGLDVPAPAHLETIMRGDAAMTMRQIMANLAAADRDRMLRGFWKSTFPGLEPKTLAATFDPVSGVERITADGEAKLDWIGGSDSTRWYEVRSGHLGWKADFKRDTGPYADAPFTVPHPTFTRMIETVVLPYDGAGFVVRGEDVDTKVAGYALNRSTRIEKGVFTAETSTRSLAGEFPASEAPASETTLSDLSKVRVWLRSPPNYRPTDADMAAIQAVVPKTAKDYLDRGLRFSRRGELDKAIADLTQSLALDPKSALALANRGISRFWKGDYDQARSDFEKAAELDPRNVIAVHGQGLLADRFGHPAEAVTYYSRALDLMGADEFALLRRAMSLNAMGQSDKALADTDQLLKLQPGHSGAHMLRSDIFRSRREFDKAIAEIDAAMAANPPDAMMATTRAAVLALAGRKPEAQAAFAASIAAKPSLEAYLTRARYRDRNDIKGRLADIDAALKLDPKALPAISMRAKAQSDAGDPMGAATLLTRALQDQPDDPSLLVARATAYVAAKKPELAQRDFGIVRAKAISDPVMLNNLCWTQATLGFSLDRALGDCEAALKLTRQPEVIDSHAFALLRLGRFQESVAEYDTALVARPGGPASLYGRGLAKLRLGKTSEGQADLAAARALSDKIDEDFAGFGMKP